MGFGVGTQSGSPYRRGAIRRHPSSVSVSVTSPSPSTDIHAGSRAVYAVAGISDQRVFLERRQASGTESLWMPGWRRR